MGNLKVSDTKSRRSPLIPGGLMAHNYHEPVDGKYVDEAVMILSNVRCSSVVKVLNTLILNSPKFQFVQSRKLGDLCSKIYEKSLN